MIYNVDAIPEQYKTARQALITAKAKETKAIHDWQAYLHRRPNPSDAERQTFYASIRKAQEARAQADQAIRDVIHSAPLVDIN